MKKLQRVEVDNNLLNINKLYSTEYDNLFQTQIKFRGIDYYRNHKVSSIHKNGETVTAVVIGSNTYNVSIKYVSKNQIEVACDCPYHKEIDIYCKHIYGALITLKMIYEKEKLKNIFENNINKIKEILNMIDELLLNNKSIIENFKYSWGKSLKDFYDKFITEMQENFIIENDYKVTYQVGNSFYHLNHIIDDYNELLDYISERELELKEEKRKEKNTVSFEFTIDDSGVYDVLDNYFASMPREVLEQVRNDDIERGENTEIIDKAIAERKKRDEDEKLRQISNEIKEQKQERKATIGLGKMLFFGLLGAMFSPSSSKSKSSFDYLMPWEQDLVNKGNYDPWNFEEEELEEDDYYYEDDI